MQETARSPTQLGHIIKQRRKALKLTQNALAIKVGTRQTTVSLIEKGEPGTHVKTIFDTLIALELEVVIRPREKNTVSFEDIF